MAIDIKELESKLETLRGLDFIAAEKEERSQGNTALLMNFSASFQARLAALALSVPVSDIQELPLKKFNQVVNIVNAFLVRNSDETETP